MANISSFQLSQLTDIVDRTFQDKQKTLPMVMKNSGIVRITWSFCWYSRERSTYYWVSYFHSWKM